MTQKSNIEITVKNSLQTTLSFDEDASTGYIWTHNSVNGLEISTTFNNISILPADMSMGGTAEKTFEIKADRRGEYKVTFNHARPWDPDQMIETREYTYKFI